MSARAAALFVLLTLCAAVALAPPAAQAQTARSIVTTENADYFGFDLRTERDVTLEQCQAVCLGDPSCRAFTYNTRAGWCFLKSDFSAIAPFAGAVAGRVVEATGEPDIGAPPALAFLPTEVLDRAAGLRNDLGSMEVSATLGIVGLASAGESALTGGNGAAAVDQFLSALAIDAERPLLWTRLAQAALVAVGGQRNFVQDAMAASVNAYRTSRSARERAEALSVMARALERGTHYRAAITAYQRSLELVADAAVQAAYEDLRARRGFRVTGHSVDADTTTPRVCVQFSEPLVKSGVDYASFVALDGQSAAAVEAAERQLCVEGLSHGRNYRITLRQGLPSTVDETLTSPVALEVYVRDRQPSARFTGDGFVLPSTARRGIPLVTVNMDRAHLDIYRIGDRSLAALASGYQFLRQIDGYSASRFADEMGEPVWSGTIDIERGMNTEVVTSIPIDEAVPERRPGVYVMTARPENDASERWDQRATQWFIVSDIGLSTFTGVDGLSVFARSLATAAPLEGVRVALLAKNNEILGQATTDTTGRAVFDAGLTRGSGGMTPAVMSAESGDDFAFLDMTRAGFDLSDRGVAGRPAPGALDVFAWTERGIYRAGETVHVSALLRDDLSEATPDLPLTFIFWRPDGKEDRRVVSDRPSLGGHAVAFDLTDNAMRGSWQVWVRADPDGPTLASKTFLVEDFTPDRIEFDLSADRDSLAPGDTATLRVEGRFLYGAPAAGLSLEGEASISPTGTWAAFPGYAFGLADEDGDSASSRIVFEDLPLTDEAGNAEFVLDPGALPSTTRLLKAEIAVRMREGGGRAVERRLALSFAPETDMIGIRPEFEGAVPQGGTAAFRVLAADPEGRRIDMPGASWTLVKVIRNYQWYRRHGMWDYEAITVEEKIADGTFDISTSAGARIALPVDWGRYRLEVESPDAEAVTSVAFDAGWYVDAGSTETPDGLEIALDRETYAVGDTARLQVSPSFAGELMVVIGADRIIDIVNATVPGEGAEIALPVTEAWGAGAYVTAVLHRPGDSVETRMPMRAVGVRWAGVDPAGRRLAVALETPERSAPRAPLTIPVSVAAAAGEEAWVSIAAVDVGILNLTRYEPPEPSAWYFGQRRLGLVIRDLYGRLIDGSLGASGRLRTGGDGGEVAVSGSPPTEELVAFFEGPVRLDAEGRATVSFDLPQFNGTVRVVAVAWTRTGVGEAQADVVVRDPVVVTASLPRFLAPGDGSELRLDIANTDGPAGEYRLSIAENGAVAVDGAERALSLDAGQRTTLTLPLEAFDVGDGSLTVTLAMPDGVSLDQTLVLPVRAPAVPMASRQVVSLAPGGSLRVDRGLFADSYLAGAAVSVGVSRHSAFDLPSMLMSLDRYPYGCAEQTVSRALPLLYVSELSQAAGLPDDPDLADRIQNAVSKVIAFQASAGSFGLWSPGWGDLWLDSYVTDFLSRAREKGFQVPEQAMRLALDNLANSIAYQSDIAERGREIAYATYVLARNGRASAGDLRYYSETMMESFDTPLARAQIAAGLALYGDGQRSERAFGSALALARDQARTDWSRGDYGSALRDGAAMLALAAESRPTPAVVPTMVELVSRRSAVRRGMSTQEEAWMLLAARAVRDAGEPLSLEVDGEPRRGNLALRLAGEAVENAPLTIVNRGGEAVEAVVTAIAAPRDPLPAGGDGFSIERAYYRMDGSPANVSEVRQNERFVAVLTIREDNAWPSRVLVADLLPAGFQIDNPNVVGSAQLENFGWLGEIAPAHVEFREDRFIAAFDREASSDREFMLAYVVRAVTPGTYVHPAANVEDMYRPHLSARTATGAMEVRR